VKDNYTGLPTFIPKILSKETKHLEDLGTDGSVIL
jgi:hypothetical protein